ncbi:MAG: iron chelate uptake ABC transporter family permease subunit, partial [Rhodococcus sp. (in: high G+C Gram-positive bacteria)]
MVARGRSSRSTRRRTTIAVLALFIVLGFAVTLMVGRTFYPPAEVVRVLLGQDVAGASYTVGRLRLPRAFLAITAGLCFGIAGVTFQTMLRNPLASPDIIGISAGSSAAAAFAIVTLGLGSTQVSIFAIVSGLAVALMVYVLSFKDGIVGTRLILIGIGIAAMLDSVTAYILSRAGQWDLQEATRWLTGSLNGTSWSSV